MKKAPKPTRSRQARDERDAKRRAERAIRSATPRQKKVIAENQRKAEQRGTVRERQPAEPPNSAPSAEAMLLRIEKLERAYRERAGDITENRGIVRERVAAEPPNSAPNTDALLLRIERLERAYRERVGDIDDLASRPVLLAKKGDSGFKTFKEQAIVGGAFVDFADGRKCTADSQPFALVDGQQDVFGVVAYPDGDVMRYALLPAGIRDIRDNTVLNKIQVTYKPNPNPDLSAGNTDWVDRIDVNACETAAGAGMAAGTALFGTGAESFFESPESVVAYTKSISHTVEVSTADTSTTGTNAVQLLHFNTTAAGGLLRLVAQATGPTPRNVVRIWHEPGGAGTFTASSSSGLLGTMTSGNNGTLKHLTRVQFTTTDTLPTGLSAATDYWVVYVSSTTFRVATSYANAIAGTVVAWTDAGTGTHTVTPVKLWLPEFDLHLAASTPDGIETPSIAEWVSTDPINGRLFDPDGKLYCAPYEAATINVFASGAQA